MKNRSFTGGRRSVGTPTLNKNQYYQLIREIKKSRSPAATGKAATAETDRQKGQGDYIT